MELKCHRTVLILAGVLVDLHASPADPASRECGPVNMEAVQQVIPRLALRQAGLCGAGGGGQVGDRCDQQPVSASRAEYW